MKECAIDPCFLYSINDSNLTGLAGLSTDDSINTGSNTYQIFNESAKKSFTIKGNDKPRVVSIGFHAEQADTSLQTSEGPHIENQINYIQTI